MPIKFNCHKCGANLRVPEQHIGKKARCPKCDEKCVVPEVSQRDSGGLSGGFDELGNLGEPSVGMPPASDIPMAAPATAVPLSSPAAASPMALPSSVPAVSPYSSSVSNKGSGLSGTVIQPLYEARTFIKITGWSMVVLGVLYCISIIYAIVGWLPLWMGWQLKGAGEALTVGVETGDQTQIHLACQRLATYFKIVGVLTLIGLVMMAIAVLFGVVMLIIGLSSGNF